MPSGRTAIPTAALTSDGQSERKPDRNKPDRNKPDRKSERIAWRSRASQALWFGRSLRTQILMVFVALSVAAASVAGAVIIYKAGVSTRIEIAGSMRLARLMVNEAVQLIEQGLPADQFLQGLPRRMQLVRHVRVVVHAAGPGAASADPGPPPPDRAAAPAWFAMLIGPPVERHEVELVAHGERLGTVEIVSEPGDEIAEAWSNTVALAAVAAITELAIVAMLHLVLGRVLDPLRALGAGLQDLEGRDYRVRLEPPEVKEFAALADRFNALAGALEAARTENLGLSRRLITAQDDERRRTALELHDEVGPSLFGLKANVASIAGAVAGHPGVDERLRDLTAIVDHLQGVNRAMLNRLRPMALGNLPLADIIAGLVRDRAREHPHIAFGCDLHGLERSYDDTVDLTVYRCVQESLTNAIRHAGAASVAVTVAARAASSAAPAADAIGAGAADSLDLTVCDDGVGFSPGTAPGFGITGMQERVQALGGAFAIGPAAGGGTCVRIAIPLPVPGTVSAVIAVAP